MGENGIARAVFFSSQCNFSAVSSPFVRVVICRLMLSAAEAVSCAESGPVPKL